MNELKNELKIELSCGRCGLTKVIVVNMDADGVFTIPNKFCPNDLNELSRDVLRNFVSVPKKPDGPDKDGGILVHRKVLLEKSDEPTEDKARTSNAVPRPTRPVDLSKNGANSSKKA